MKIIDHGHFTPYVPSMERLRELDVSAADPETGTQGVLFARNEQGRDFYDMEFEGAFAIGSMLVSVNDKGVIVGASFTGSRVVPAKDCRLFELQGSDVPTRLESVSGKFIDVATGTLTNPPKQGLVPTSVSDRQFFQGLAMMGEITRAEALVAVKTGDMPDKIQQMVDSIPDAGKRFDAQMMLSGATSFERDNILVDTFAAGHGWTKEQTDEFFRFCAGL